MNTLKKWLHKARQPQQKSKEFWAKEMTYEKLGYLLAAHMTLVESLSILNQHDVLDELTKGKTLSNILKERRTKTFIVSRLAQGEKTAALPEACADIASVLRKEKEIKSKIILTLLYPSVLLLATFGIVIFLVAYIFPKMMPLFLNAKTSLPFTTRIVLWFSHSVQEFWWVYVLSAITAAISIFYLRGWIIYVPLLKEWYISQKISQYFNRISSYLESGQGLDEACNECAQTEISPQFRAVYTHVALCVRQGISFAYVIEKHALFPKEISSMIIVGENSGRLAPMCRHISEMYEKRFSNYTKTITSAVEPVCMLGMGGVVGFIALSMITPLYSITQNVQ